MLLSDISEADSEQKYYRREKMKKTAKFLSCLLLGALCLENAVAAITFSGTEKEPTVTQLYPGVVHTYIKTTPKSSATYGMANINVLEVDLSNPNLHFEVVGGGKSANSLGTVKETCENYNKQNEDKTAIAAVNGDLWMVGYAHARYDMSIVNKGYEGDGLVCKKAMTLPRGFNVYDGEIITTPHMNQEKPFEGAFQSFGITSDGELILGQPRAEVQLFNSAGTKITSIDGINRLPANDAIVLYSDVALSGNDYSLDDAYEILVETNGDYKVSHGAQIKGKVKAIYDSKTKENAPKLKENQYMLTVRGNRVSRVTGIKVGDELTVKVEIKATSSSAKWQKIQYAVGGHIQFARNGKYTGQYAGDNYPSTFVGTTNDGKLILVTYDGRQSTYSVGPNVKAMKALVEDLNIKNAFYVDGGGSTTMVLRDKNDSGYDVVNSPSDSGRRARDVVNSIIISCNSSAINDTTWTPGSTTTAPETQPPETTAPETTNNETTVNETTTPPVTVDGTTDGSTDVTTDGNTADTTDGATVGSEPSAENTEDPTGDNEIKFPGSEETTISTPEPGGDNNTAIIITVCVAVVVIALGVGAVIFIKKKKS